MAVAEATRGDGAAALAATVAVPAARRSWAQWAVLLIPYLWLLLLFLVPFLDRKSVV